eukprot:UN03016
MAKIKGAKVIAVTSPGKRNKVAEYNPDVVCGYDDMVESVKNFTNGEGANVVYDSVGKDTWDKSLKP